MEEWQKIDATDATIVLWDRQWPRARSTGFLTKFTPTLDIDVLDPIAAQAIEEFVRGRYEADRGYVLVRFGQAPKRAIPFRTDEPFKKITANFVAPNGAEGQKLELLADGQQVVAFGIHPTTTKPYTWFGGEPGEIKREDLPYLSQDEAHQLIDDCAELLVRLGYQRAKAREGNGQDAGGGAADWQYLFDNIREGRDLHNSLRDLAAKLIRSGTSAGAAVNQLRGLMEGSTAPHDDRWKERFAEIPRLVESAEELFAKAADRTASKGPEFPPHTIAQTLDVFQRWLIRPDPTPIYAILGAIAANLLPGDPVWLALIAPPSSAKMRS
jgi:hypothetical protein